MRDESACAAHWAHWTAARTTRTVRTGTSMWQKSHSMSASAIICFLFFLAQWWFFLHDANLKLIKNKN